VPLRTEKAAIFGPDVVRSNESLWTGVGGNAGPMLPVAPRGTAEMAVASAGYTDESKRQGMDTAAPGLAETNNVGAKVLGYTNERRSAGMCSAEAKADETGFAARVAGEGTGRRRFGVKCSVADFGGLECTDSLGQRANTLEPADAKWGRAQSHAHSWLERRNQCADDGNGWAGAGGSSSRPTECPYSPRLRG
jgi:hypothetical protein